MNLKVVCLSECIIKSKDTPPQIIHQHGYNYKFLYSICKVCLSFFKGCFSIVWNKRDFYLKATFQIVYNIFC